MVPPGLSSTGCRSGRRCAAWIPGTGRRYDRIAQGAAVLVCSAGSRAPAVRSRRAADGVANIRRSSLILLDHDAVGYQSGHRRLGAILHLLSSIIRPPQSVGAAVAGWDSCPLRDGAFQEPMTLGWNIQTYDLTGLSAEPIQWRWEMPSIQQVSRVCLRRSDSMIAGWEPCGKHAGSNSGALLASPGTCV